MAFSMSMITLVIDAASFSQSSKTSSTPYKQSHDGVHADSTVRQQRATIMWG